MSVELFIKCYPTDKGAKHFPNSNFAIKPISVYEIIGIYNSKLKETKKEVYVEPLTDLNNVRGGFTKEIIQSKENEGKQAGIWKDANDFPKRGDLYFTKIRMIDGPEEWFPAATNYYKEWEISEDYEVVEWLDESIQSGERGEVERLKGE